MLVSLRRVALVTYAVIILIVITTYEIFWEKRGAFPTSFLNAFGNSTFHSDSPDIKSPVSVVPATDSPIPSTTDLTTKQKASRFAYAQYATNLDYLCNTVINFNRLKGYGIQHGMVLIYPQTWDDEKAKSREAKAIRSLRSSHPDIVLRSFNVLSTEKGDSTWRDSLTKFHAFALTDYTRVLAFDSDSLVLNNMDSLFLAPDSPVALPRAYWLTERHNGTVTQILGSHLMLIEPNTHLYEKIVGEATRSGEFDMEVMNELFKDSAMILPHRRIALLTGEFRAKEHRKYLAPDEDEEWNPINELKMAFLVHFSDWPLPKPWKSHSEAQWEAALPECLDNDKGMPGLPRCADRVVWTGVYSDYDRDKAAYCQILGV
ncbi:hypothetical protein TGAMA5MH_04955 [Trichoderma gamsii]|uniref:Glucose N-acetyltransferase n=1 Tax=Trichoderma gamsii TaxID=398673 RepID=A0A2K0TBX6_9HYPO|nr:hypothetical protein TGAMA5MH_04955 [Trichoderma gamsii]